MAPQFEDTHYDMADFHEQQLEHYRKKGKADLQRQAVNTDKPLPPTPLTKREGKRPDRQSAGLEMATKHLGKLDIHDNVSSNTHGQRHRTYSPARASPVGSPQAPDRIRRIMRNSEGKFEESNIVEHSFYPLRPHSPEPPRREITYRDSSRPSSSASRPGSSGSMFSRVFSFERRGSDASNAQGKSPSRPGSSSSFKDTWKRVSHEISRGKDIISMNQHDRDRWMADEKSRIQAEGEQFRRENRKTRQLVPPQRTSTRQDPQPPVRTSTTTTTIPSPTRESVDSDQMRPAPLNAGTKAALAFSKATDWAKKRKGSEDSDMDLFADCAPVGMLENCQRCQRPVTDCLTQGLCKDCWRRRVNEFWEDSTPPQDECSEYSDDSTRSSSPSAPREVNEEEYMKVAADRRIRRIRRTIYSDPGNPFAFGDDDDPSGAPTTLFHRSRDVSPALSESRVVSDQPRLKLNDSPASMKEESTAVLDESPTSPPTDETFTHVRDSLLYAPTPRRSGTPALIKQHSTVPLPPSPQLLVEKEEGVYLLPKASPRKRSIRWGGPESPTPRLETSEGEGGVRNTMYCGFYDQVLQEYHRSRERLGNGNDGEGYI